MGAITNDIKKVVENKIQPNVDKYKDLLIPLGTLGAMAIVDKIDGEDNEPKEEKNVAEKISDTFGWREADKMPDVANEEYEELMNEENKKQEK